MTTLNSLKQQLRQTATETYSCPKRPLTDTEYSVGFTNLVEDSGWATYQSFIIPQLSRILTPLFSSQIHVSVLEIGPGPKSVLRYLPLHHRRKITKYTAFEPNELFATSLEESINLTRATDLPFPSLESPPKVHQFSFGLESNTENNFENSENDDGKFDVILFCHSMYGMSPKRKFVECALGMLSEKQKEGTDPMVVVFHRAGSLDFEGLVCHQTASFHTGVTRVRNDALALDSFASFITGYAFQDVNVNKSIQLKWRDVCRSLGREQPPDPGYISFSSPNIMVAFTKHATGLSELLEYVPFLEGAASVKNREARLHRPAAVTQPTEIRHIQQCVLWALKNRTRLTMIGGGHSGHCLQPNVVAVDMSAFDKIHILKMGDAETQHESGALVVVESGCKTGDVIRKTMQVGLTVPLGARPSVGAGLWLQGGISHLARLHGLSCDAIVGAVVVSVDSGEIVCVGSVPTKHQPPGSIRPENGSDLLWGLKGAGTNFGIVVSVTFRGYPAPTYSVRNWVVPLNDSTDAQMKMRRFNAVSGKLPQNCSADAFLYSEDGQLQLGVTTFEFSTSKLNAETPKHTLMSSIFGQEDSSELVDGLGLFETEMYMGMHGGHSSAKTSSFKRCLLLNLDKASVMTIMVAALETRPTPFCYLHLLHGGGAISDIAPDETAFGCRDWDFACVVTGVWLRDQDGTEIARSTVEWVYKVALGLLPLTCGVYGADLGPDLRDTPLAAKAFGPNLPRLAQLKLKFDPNYILAYSFPIPRAPTHHKLIVLVTGESGAGKDYCADIWASVLTANTNPKLTVRVISISEAAKKEYSEATGAELKLLLSNREYKEKHRPALTAFFQDQVRQRPQLPKQHFLNVVRGNKDFDVLIITGMRDEAPVSTLSHLVPESKLVDILVDKDTRQVCNTDDGTNGTKYDAKESKKSQSDLNTLDYCPTLIFKNNMDGAESVKSFAKEHLLPFLHEDLLRLANMVGTVPNFPRQGINFRHVLDIPQQPGGLILCASLFHNHFPGDWEKVDVVACCEAGGFIFASVLAAQIDKPLALIRQAGKLPPPTISAGKPSSYISSSTSQDPQKNTIELGKGVIPTGASVVVVDDVLATGETLCAVLQLLRKAGAEDVSVMVAAEFPLHRGRKLLRDGGFGKVNIQSLLVFDGT